ncbi:MAG: HAMP domain-containing protein, partial [Chloroflexi bacterium]|nr:HAMP domain-containing protein [Chloroflexota bacterium]
MFGRDRVNTTVLLNSLVAVKNGDFATRLPLHWTGIAGKVADTFNGIVEMNQRLSQELLLVGKEVGQEGKTSRRAALGDTRGAWRGIEESINGLVGDLVRPASEMANVVGAVGKGDLTLSVPLEVEGRPLQGVFREYANTVNSMVDQLNAFASEVTRVAREVGTDGKLGGQAAVRGVSGTWKDLTDNVNSMAANLTSQVRNIATVTTAVATGDLNKKITVDARGEIL